MLNVYLLNDHSSLTGKQFNEFVELFFQNKWLPLYYWKIGQTRDQNTSFVPCFVLSYSAFFWATLYANYFSIEETFLHDEDAYEQAVLGTKERGDLFRFSYILDDLDYTTFQEKMLRYFHQILVKRRKFVRLVPYVITGVISCDHQDKSYLRHLEVNPLTASLTVLPIPYFYFYTFLLDQTALWKTVLMELAMYHKD